MAFPTLTSFANMCKYAAGPCWVTQNQDKQLTEHAPIICMRCAQDFASKPPSFRERLPLHLLPPSHLLWALQESMTCQELARTLCAHFTGLSIEQKITLRVLETQCSEIGFGSWWLHSH